MMENVMEHIAHDLKIDPLQFRLLNMKAGDTEANLVPSIVESLKSSSQFEMRKQEVDTFNAGNRWKKRGLSMIPMLYPQTSGGALFYFQMNIFSGDGSISITCGAVEMGQVSYYDA